MSDVLHQNGWNEWSKHVLKELERHNSSLTKIQEDISSLKGQMLGVSAKEMTRITILTDSHSREMESIKDDSSKLRERIRELENAQKTFLGKWSIIGIIGTAALSVIVSFVMNMFEAQTIKHPAPNPPAQIRGPSE